MAVSVSIEQVRLKVNSDREILCLNQFKFVFDKTEKEWRETD